MSWVNDLASMLGAPAGAATVAAARPEALEDISRILKNPLWTKALQPSLIIERLFVYTFGESHLCLKCAVRSVLASAIFITSSALIIYTETAKFPELPFENLDAALFFAMLYLIAGLFPAYVALAKTRVVIHEFSGKLSKYAIILVVVDLLLSLSISYFFLALSLTPEDIINSNSIVELGFFPAIWDHLINFDLLEIKEIIDAGEPSWLFTSGSDNYPWWILFLLSTTFTSIWTILILLSSITLKLVLPLQTFSIWFFDIEKHPVQAIGIVSGALVIFGGLIWFVVRALI